MWKPKGESPILPATSQQSSTRPVEGLLIHYLSGRCNILRCVHVLALLQSWVSVQEHFMLVCPLSSNDTVFVARSAVIWVSYYLTLLACNQLIALGLHKVLKQIVLQRQYSICGELIYDVTSCLRGDMALWTNLSSDSCTSPLLAMFWITFQIMYSVRASPVNAQFSLFNNGKITFLLCHAGVFRCLEC